MHRTQRTAQPAAKHRKVHRNFKLHPKLDGILKKESVKQRRTQTALVEMALSRFFNLI
jgi:hypothetical protein